MDDPSLARFENDKTLAFSLKILRIRLAMMGIKKVFRLPRDVVTYTYVEKPQPSFMFFNDKGGLVDAIPITPEQLDKLIAASDHMCQKVGYMQVPDYFR